MGIVPAQRRAVQHHHRARPQRGVAHRHAGGAGRARRRVRVGRRRREERARHRCAISCALSSRQRPTCSTAGERALDVACSPDSSSSSRLPQLAALFRPSVQPYLMSWFKYVPATELARLTIPVLLIQGTTDIQVPVAEAKALQAAEAQRHAQDRRGHESRHEDGDGSCQTTRLVLRSDAAHCRGRAGGDGRFRPRHLLLRGHGAATSDCPARQPARHRPRRGRRRPSDDRVRPAVEARPGHLGHARAVGRLVDARRR